MIDFNTSNFNVSDLSEQELLNREFFKLGHDIGKYINQFLLDNGYGLGETGPVILTLKDLKPMIVDSPYHRFLAKIGTSDVSTVMNGGLYVGNVGTIVFSCIRVYKTTNTAAKLCYIGSALCGAGGAITSGASTLSRSSKFDAYGSGLLGTSQVFYRAGNFLHDQGLKAEGKVPPVRVSPRLTDRFRITSKFIGANKNAKGIAFNMPDHYKSVSFITILKGTIVLISIYSYIKLLSSSYKRGKKLLTDYKQRKESEFTLQKVNYFCKCLKSSDSVSIIIRIWFIANSTSICII